jgi:hypothetical protein
LKNQFRSLDADEIDFLDSVLEKTRADEERIKQETKTGLELFRQRQDEADKAARELEKDLAADEEADPEEPAGIFAPKKRKRAKEVKGLKGVKRRKSSLTGDGAVDVPSSTPSNTAKSPTTKSTAIESDSEVEAKPTAPISTSQTAATPAPAAKARFSLVDYGSDSDDD